MEKIKIEFQKLNPDAIVPSYGTSFAAGADLYSAEWHVNAVLPLPTRSEL